MTLNILMKECWMRQTFKDKSSWLFHFFCTFAVCLVNIKKRLNIELQGIIK